MSPMGTLNPTVVVLDCGHEVDLGDENAAQTVSMVRCPFLTCPSGGFFVRRVVVRRPCGVERRVPQPGRGATPMRPIISPVGPAPVRRLIPPIHPYLRLGMFAGLLVALALAVFPFGFRNPYASRVDCGAPVTAVWQRRAHTTLQGGEIVKVRSKTTCAHKAQGRLVTSALMLVFTGAGGWAVAATLKSSQRQQAPPTPGA